MRRDLMLMEAILGQLLQSPDPQMSASGIAQRLNVEAAKPDRMAALRDEVLRIIRR